MGKKLGLYEVFGTDKESETEGVWIEYGDTGASFKLARIGGENSAYGRYLSAAIKPFKHQIDTDTLSDEKAKEIYIRTFIATVLKDWKGVTDEKGKGMAFSPENAKKLLTDLPLLYQNLVKEAGNFENYRKASDEATAKNSEKSSAGS